MQPSRRHCAIASLALTALLLLAPRTNAGTLVITSTPAGANLEIDGTVVGVTPYQIDYPGGYFRKPHTVFSSRLEHAMVARISFKGFLSQQITLTEGPFQWVSVTGRKHGTYFLLKADHFSVQLEPAVKPATTAAGPNAGPMRPSGAASHPDIPTTDPIPDDAAKIKITAEPAIADIFVDGKFVGQSPATIHLTPGMHRIEIKTPGRQTWTRELDVLKESQITLHAVLEP
jgi:hypothetical protein